tara:strand:+ start:2945 stop:4780 length:1836 start_codon:yes stop_codon:yes gene_type:complete
MDIKISSNIEIIKKSSNYDIDFIDVQLKYLPLEDDRQTILSKKIIADEAQVKDNDFIDIKWNNPDIGSYDYSVNSIVKTTNDFKKITNNLHFPIQNINSNLIQYTNEEEFIDINEDIRELATEIVEGETDLYVAVFKIGDWINKNIEYDLSTLTANVVQRSSWVLDNKQGVCDEITNLFISMLRSLNIPARFIGGVVYTNVGDYFGNHGWAEVYLEGHGWVPFDVTFGQYGWIDPSHIKLSSTIDSGEPAVEYSWRSRGIDLEPKELKIETTVKKTEGRVTPYTILNIKPLEDKVKFGSYVPLEVSVKNVNPFYVPLTLLITKSPNLLEDNNKEILLKPNEEKKVFWTLEIGNKFNSKYIYTSELEVESSFGASASNVIKFAQTFGKTDLDDAEETIKELESREEKTFLTDLNLDCNSEKNVYYSDEKININCVIENTGNKNLEDLKVCVIINCKNINLRINEKTDLDFQTKLSTSRELKINAETEEFIKYDNVNLKIIKLPKIRFINIEPTNLNYNQNDNVSFNIFSNTLINNITLEIDNIGEFDLENFDGNYNIIFETKGKNIKKGLLKIKLIFKDELGVERKHEEIHKIEIKNIPWYVNLWNKIFRRN